MAGTVAKRPGTLARGVQVIHLSKSLLSGKLSWLECCGHLSAFTIDGIHYCGDEEMRDLKGWLWLVGRQAMQMAVGEVMHQGQISAYEYDFGSTTALLLFSIIVVVEDDGP